MGGTSTGHEVLTNTLLVFETARPGVLVFKGERSLSARHGRILDAALHIPSGRIYLILNTPHSAKSKDPLTTGFGTLKDFLSGRERYAELGISRKGDAQAFSACAKDSLLVCYEGNIYSFDADTLEYQCALPVKADIIKTAGNDGEYVLALCSNKTEVKRLTPQKKARRK
jgi:hypothetical protein